MIRINKFIANNSEYSRRKVDELLEEGKVFVNGQKIQDLGTQIDPTTDTISIEGKTINAGEEKIYLILNKPKNYLTTRSDELERKTVMDLIPEYQNLKPAGRLDKDSEGLLILTNDGDYINQLTHPKHKFEKEYIVEIDGKLKKSHQEKLEKGIIIDQRKTAPAKIKINKISERKTNLTIIIREGRNRQIRKMFAQLNYPVKYLQRIRIGNIELGSLKTGEFRHLTKNEIKC